MRNTLPAAQHSRQKEIGHRSPLALVRLKATQAMEQPRCIVAARKGHNMVAWRKDRIAVWDEHLLVARLMSAWALTTLISCRKLLPIVPLWPSLPKSPPYGPQAMVS
jgi:hypothetical protein